MIGVAPPVAIEILDTRIRIQRKKAHGCVSVVAVGATGRDRRLTVTVRVHTINARAVLIDAIDGDVVGPAVHRGVAVVAIGPSVERVSPPVAVQDQPTLADLI